MLVESMEVRDPLFREAVAAIDTGDTDALKRLLTGSPELLHNRADCGEGYFSRPYLLWFVAENPVRNGRLPGNIAEVTRLIIEAAQRCGVESLQEQIDYTLSLVCSGRITREYGVQLELIDTLVEAGADPTGALHPALAHKENAAIERLLVRGAELTPPVAVCIGRSEDAVSRLESASDIERQSALAAAALYGRAQALSLIISYGADVNAYSPAGFHSNGTPLHHAVSSGCLDAVKVLVQAGAALDVRDRMYNGTSLHWAEYFGFAEIATYLREQQKRR